MLMKSCKNDIIVPMMSMKIWVTYIYLHGLFTEFQLTGSSGIFTGFFYIYRKGGFPDFVFQKAKTNVSVQRFGAPALKVQPKGEITGILKTLLSVFFF